MQIRAIFLIVLTLIIGIGPTAEAQRHPNRQKSRARLTAHAPTIWLKAIHETWGSETQFSFPSRFPYDVDHLEKSPFPRLIARRNGCSLFWFGGNAGVNADLRVRCGNNQYFAIEIQTTLTSTPRTIAKQNGQYSCAPRRETITRPIIYVPAIEILQSAEAAQEGFLYLYGAVARSIATLKDTPSRAEPKKTIGKIMTPHIMDIVLELLNEKMDEGQFLASYQDTARFGALIAKILSEFGNNGARAGIYSTSKAGARGISQFMCGTYALILTGYPEVGLIPNFFQGMEDHLNSLKALAILWDYERARWRDEARRVCDSSPALRGECWVVSHNGGKKRTDAVVARWGYHWSETLPAFLQGNRLILPSTVNEVIPTETVLHHLKFKTIKQFFGLDAMDAPKPLNAEDPSSHHRMRS